MTSLSLGRAELVLATWWPVEQSRTWWKLGLGPPKAFHSRAVAPSTRARACVTDAFKRGPRDLVCFRPHTSPTFVLIFSASSDTLLVMEYAGRRSTMQPHADPFGNARSALPVPSTVKKSTTGHGRMSLAGPAMRAPYPMAPPSNPRQSLMRSQNVNPLLQSASKPQNFGRTPMHK